MSVIKYKTSSPAGDLLSLLPSIRQVYRSTGKKAVVYQALNVPGEGIPGVPQPYKNNIGESIMMGEETFRMLEPLLKAQEYIQDFNIFEGQEVDYDFDRMRLETFVNQPLGSINRWAWYVFPEMACDLSESWIDVKKNNSYSDKIILNFTDRYRNNWVNYYFLKEYKDNIYFAGLPKEHINFCNKWGLEIPILSFSNFLELAEIINGCRVFLSNASLMFQIAEGLKVNRVLETFYPMPNVIPFGKNGFDFYHQKPLELYLNKLYNNDKRITINRI